MKKKSSSKKRQKPKTRRNQKARAKTRPRVITGVDPGEDRAGQDETTESGDTQSLSADPSADSESVKELEEEGQYLEAEVVEGVEDAPDADAGPVKTKEVPEDDVPGEYRVGDNRDQQS